MIDELQLDVEHAEAIVEAGIEFEVHTEDMPDSDADKIEAAHDLIAMAIDSWVDDEVRPDSDDKRQAEAGLQIQQMLEIAGIEINEDNEVEYGELPEIVDADDASDNSGDETPFDINDVIDGYDDMKVAEIVEAMAGLEDDDIETVKEYESEEGRGRKAILNFEPEDGSSGDDGDSGDNNVVDLDALDRKELIALIKSEKLGIATRGKDEDELKSEIQSVIDESSGDGGGDGDDAESGEPWEGYDEAKITEIKAQLTELANADDEEDRLTTEQAQYVLDYEQGREKPRSSLVKWLGQLLEEMTDGGGGDDDEAGAQVDEAVAKDDRKDKRRAAKPKAGTIVLTREMVLEALAEGEITIELA